jgi:hypothetical protein
MEASMRPNAWRCSLVGSAEVEVAGFDVPEVAFDVLEVL